MAIAEMKLVNIVGRLKNFDTVVRSCCLRGDFHPEQSSAALDEIEEFSPITDYNPYTSILQKAVDIAVRSNVTLRYNNFDKLEMSDSQLEDYVKKIGSEVKKLDSNVRNITSEIARLKEGLTQLSHLKNLDISLDDIFSCKFFHFRFGRLPKDSYPKLEICDDSESLFFFPLEEDVGYYWGFYVALDPELEKIDQLFNSLYFERINPIEEAHGKPAEAVARIRKNLEEKRAALHEAKAAVSKFWQENEDKFLRVYSKLKYLSDSFDLRRYAAKCGDNFYILGWIPKDKAADFAKQFEKLSDVDCVIEGIEEAGDIDPPISLVNNKLAKPFEMFTGLYGLPNYHEIDPTAFMAFTYTLFFGIMFGDLGQGIGIFLAGLFCKAKKLLGDMGGILIRLGISSAIFGFLYNSVFGYEGVLPFTILPVHDNSNVMIVLVSAVGLGVVTIMACMVINIINGIKQKNKGKILFDANGLSGLIFYGSVILGCVMFLIFKKNVFTLPFILILIILPLILVFFKEPLARLLEHKKEIIPGSKGEFFLTAFFELFDVLLSFFSNTISFMRIGAFILSHAGMMFAVFAIGNMFGTCGNIIAQIIGNVFVMALEGLIVGIQGIRLHFYEMFSRFYSGTGKPYKPAKIIY